MQVCDDSGWEWDTSANVNAGVEFMNGTLGHFVFNDPQGLNYRFSYGTVGAGLGKTVGPVSLAFSTEDNFSLGRLYRTFNSQGRALTENDIEGLCLSIDGGCTGFSGSVMLLGIPHEHIDREISGRLSDIDAGPFTFNLGGVALAPYFRGKLLEWFTSRGSSQSKAFFETNARAVMFMGGVSQGWPSAGIGASVGIVSLTQIVPSLSNTPMSPESPY